MLNYRKKYISGHLLFMLCLLTMLLSACDLFGGNNPSSTRPLIKAPLNKQTYTLPQVGLPNSDLDTLDPALAHDTSSIQAVQMLYTGLVQLDDKLQVQPQLAQSWSLGADGTTWTFHLKPHLTFSDGTPLTSADVAYSIDRALQPATQSSVAPIYLELIQGADQLISGHASTVLNIGIFTPDPNTVIIHTKQAASYFLSMLTYTCSYVVEQSLIKQYGSKFTDHLNTGGGAGPFKVSTYTHQASISFVPSPHYYANKPQLRKVTFVFYRSADEAYRDYQNALLDTTPLPSSLAPDKKRKDYFQIPQLWENYYTMNYLSKPFDNLHIRQAFALAIDKTAIATSIWKSTVIPTNNIIPLGMPGYNANLTGPDGTKNLTGNAQKAHELLLQGLKEEGWNSVNDIPTIKLTYVSGVAHFDQEVNALIQGWQKVLHVTVVPDPIVDYNTLLDKVTATTANQDGLQFWGLSWVAEYPDPHDWLTLQFGSANNNDNNMNYAQNVGPQAAQQQAIQKQLAAADSNSSPNARTLAYQQAEQQLVDDVAWIPMNQVTNIFLRNPSLVGFHDNGADIIPPGDWATIYRVQ